MVISLVVRTPVTPELLTARQAAPAASWTTHKAVPTVARVLIDMPKICAELSTRWLLPIGRYLARATPDRRAFPCAGTDRHAVEARAAVSDSSASERKRKR